MKTACLDYYLPPELIANFPVSPRDSSKLMIINKNKKTIEHRHFYDIIEYLTMNDVLVLNNTKVFPARAFAKKETGGKVEILLNKNIDDYKWEALCKPGLKINTKLVFDEFEAVVTERNDELHLLKFNTVKDELVDVLQKTGVTPLPPYIHSSESEKDIRQKYQTTYAKNIGSVAAPTAGFHFTDELLDKIKGKGVQIEYITLHVGLGTFAPIKSEDLEEHIMHSEYFSVDDETLERLNKAKKDGKRIVAVGSTSTRVLESIASGNKTNSTNIFIYPPYEFKFVDAMITNFHLPKSTLIALVYALGGIDLIKKAYKEAIKNKYRFYSFGDSMMISG